jgi:threonine/homoserine/homoserine lactone efflux protein
MPATHTLLAFGLVAAAFVAIPGPSNLFVVACGLQSGSRAAVAGAAGCATGALTYVAGTAAGLSAVLASSDAVLAVVHYAGPRTCAGWASRRCDRGEIGAQSPSRHARR